MQFHKLLGATIGVGLLMSCLNASAVVVAASECCGQSGTGGLSIIKTNNAFNTNIGKSQLALAQPDLEAEGGVVFESVEFVDGYDYQIARLDNLELGSYQLTLTDFAFPDPLAQVGVNLVTATESIANLMLGDTNQLQNTVAFDITNMDSYYLTMFGRSDSAAGLGLYGVELTMVSPVPLPLTALYLGSGLALLWLKRRKSY